MKQAAPAPLNAIVLVGGAVPHRVWFNNAADRGGVWLVAPDGVMFWAYHDYVAQLPVALFGDPRAFPAADPAVA